MGVTTQAQPSVFSATHLTVYIFWHLVGVPRVSAKHQQLAYSVTTISLRVF
jgi:hypothetical protein